MKWNLLMYCSKCGSEIDNNTKICMNCGCVPNAPGSKNENYDWVVTFVAVLIFSIFGFFVFFCLVTAVLVADLNNPVVTTNSVVDTGCFSKELLVSESDPSVIDGKFTTKI